MHQPNHQSSILHPDDNMIIITHQSLNVEDDDGEITVV